MYCLVCRSAWSFFSKPPPRAFKTGSKARDELEENAKRHRNWDVKIPPQVLLKMKKTPTVSWNSMGRWYHQFWHFQGDKVDGNQGKRRRSFFSIIRDETFLGGLLARFLGRMKQLTDTSPDFHPFLPGKKLVQLQFLHPLFICRPFCFEILFNGRVQQLNAA